MLVAGEHSVDSPESPSSSRAIQQAHQLLLRTLKPPSDSIAAAAAYREQVNEAAILHAASTEPQLQPPGGESTTAGAQAHQQAPVQSQATAHSHAGAASQDEQPNAAHLQHGSPQPEAAQTHSGSAEAELLDKKLELQQQQLQQSSPQQEAVAAILTVPASVNNGEPGVQAEAANDGATLPDQAQGSAATQASAPVSSTDANAEASTEPGGDDSRSTSPEAAQAQAADAHKSALPSRRRQAPIRRSTPTPLASKAAGATSKRGRGRGRAATPAARAAKQPPRRSTSRSTAGKRRRSPS